MFNILCCIVNQTLFLYITGLAVELVVALSRSTAINLTFISANRDVCCVCVKLRCLYLCGLKYGLVGYVNILIIPASCSHACQSLARSLPPTQPGHGQLVCMSCLCILSKQVNVS